MNIIQLDESVLMTNSELPNNEHVFVDVNEFRSSKYFTVDPASEASNPAVTTFIDFDLVTEVDIIDILLDRFRKIAAFDTHTEFESDTNDTVIAALKTAKYTIQNNSDTQALIESFGESFGLNRNG